VTTGFSKRNLHHEVSEFIKAGNETYPSGKNDNGRPEKRMTDCIYIFNKIKAYV